MLKLLFTAIKTYFDAGGPAGSLYTSVNGQFYLHEASQKSATFPYIVCSLVSGLPDYWFASRIHETLMIQMSIFSKKNSSTEALNIYTYLSAYFDDCDIAIAGYSDIKFERSFILPLIRDSEYNIWHQPVEYTVLLEK